MKRSIGYQFEKATQNYDVYREIGADGKPLPDGLPKEQYAINCRPTAYLPKNGGSMGQFITITIESVSKE